MMGSIPDQLAHHLCECSAFAQAGTMRAAGRSAMRVYPAHEGDRGADAERTSVEKVGAGTLQEHR